MLLLIALLAGAAVAALVVQIYGQATFDRSLVRERIGEPGRGGLAFAPNSVLRQPRGRFGFLAMLPASPEAGERMSREIARAGWQLRSGEYVGIRFICAGVGVLIALLATDHYGVDNLLIRTGIALVAAFSGWLIPRLALSRARRQRRQRIEEQLPDALTSIAKALRTGAGILQALGYAAKETPAPLGLEFQAVLRDLEMGADAEDVFEALTERVGSPDLDIAVTAIVIQRSVGGNLSEILMNVTNTIRGRANLQREVHVITTRQRLTSNAVAALPVVISALMLMINQKMAVLLFTTAVGQIALGIGIAFELFGIVLIRKFANIEV